METNYCSRCGFLLTAVGDLLQTGGQNPLAVVAAGPQLQSPRRRGLKQGVFLFLMTFLIAPLMGMITIALKIEPFLVGIAVVLCFIGGLLRMVYALMFESAEVGGQTLEEKVISGAATLRASHTPALPPQSSMPTSDYISPRAGNWRDTNELEPASVTESTTKLLEKDETLSQ